MAKPRKTKTNLMRNPLTGREASILALIAQSVDMAEDDQKAVLAALDGRALKIAKVMLGKTKGPPWAVSISRALYNWSAGLRDLRSL